MTAAPSSNVNDPDVVRREYASEDRLLVPDLDRGLAEIARVLRAGGMLVAVTYSERHLVELAAMLGRPLIASTFSGEIGGVALAAHFDPVERREVSGIARFHDLDAVHGFAEQRFGQIPHTENHARLVGVAMPFDATLPPRHLRRIQIKCRRPSAAPTGRRSR